MEDSTVSIVGIMVAAILMFVVPFVLIADRGDDIAQLTVATLTAEFANKVIESGVLTDEDYQQYLLGLASTGNTYDVDIEIKILDENTAKKTTIETANGIVGENAYYSLFTTQIEDLLTISDRSDAVVGATDTLDNSGKLILKEGDIISVTAKNESMTLSQSIKNTYYAVRGEEIHIILSTSAGTISMNGAT